MCSVIASSKVSAGRWEVFLSEYIFVMRLPQLDFEMYYLNLDIDLRFRSQPGKERCHKSGTSSPYAWGADAADSSERKEVGWFPIKLCKRGAL